jgi:hypothetical protein
MTELTPPDAERLTQLLKGAQFSGAARRKLGEFADEHGWNEDELNTVIAQLRGSADSPPASV